MKKLIAGGLALAIFSAAAAQPSGAQLERARFAIIKKTVEFLSEDTAFKKVQSHSCDGCNTIEDLKAFANSNSLTNADSKVITPLATMATDTAAASWQQSLNSFKQAAINQISGGEKTYRKNLDGFEEYTASLDAIVAGVDEQKMVATSNDTAVQQPAAQNKAGFAADGAAPFSASVLVWLPYVLAAGLLFAFIFIFLQNKKLKTGKAHYKKRAHQFEIELQEKSQALAALTAQKEQLAKDLADSELDRRSLEDRLKSLENKKAAPRAAPAATAPLAAAIAAPKQAPKTAPQPPASTIKFARYADLGDGFSNAELLDKTDGETIFELTIAPNHTTGEYKVAAHPEAQRYALSNAQYFLGKTCLYESFPSGDDAMIKTDTPGTIKLTGGKWTIVQPAKISFS